MPEQLQMLSVSAGPALAAFPGESGFAAAIRRQHWTQLGPMIERLASHGADLVSLELAGPRHEIAEALRQVRTTGGDLPVVVVSRQAEGRLGQAVVHDGSDHAALDFGRGVTGWRRAVGFAIERARERRRLHRVMQTLNAVRGVRHSIAQENVRDVLLQRVCDTLVRELSCRFAIVVTLAPDQSIDETYSAWRDGEGLDLVGLLANGSLPSCCQQALAANAPFVVVNPAATCLECPLAGHGGANAAVATVLRHDDTATGVLLVALAPGVERTEHEIAMLNGLAEDVGTALANLAQAAARQRSVALLEARAELARVAQAGDAAALLREALDHAERLTGSSLGFFHFVDEDQEQLSLQAWSTNTVATMCSTQPGQQHYPVSEAGVWADCLATRQPVIHNDYASLAGRRGLPEGHAAVVRELVVPVYHNGLAIAVMGVGNKPTRYDEDDVRAVDLLAAVTMNHVLRTRAETALRENERRLRELVRHVPCTLWSARVAALPEGAEGADIEAVRWEMTAIDANSLPLIGAARWPEEERSLTNLIHAMKREEDRQAMDAVALAACRRNLEQYSQVFGVRDEDRQTHWLQENVSLQRLAPGRWAAYGVWVDVSAQREAAQGLREQATLLAEQNDELRRFNRAVVARELRMVELKQEVNDLCHQAGQPPRYGVEPTGAPAQDPGRDEDGVR